MSKRLTMRQHKIEALKCAKDFLITKYNLYHGGYGICYALNQYCVGSSAKSLAVRSLKQYISSALGPSSWLNEWVFINCKDVKHVPLSGDPKMVQTRLNWIDWMINCLEEDERNECK